MSHITQNISGGTINMNFAEQDLPLESKVPVTSRMYERDLDIIAQAARSEGLDRSKFIRRAVLRYIKLKPQMQMLYRDLDKIFT